MTDTLQDLLDRAHKGITVVDISDKQKVPCIIFKEKKFDEILEKVAGKPWSADTNLNILQDGIGHVFVEIILTFSQGKFVEKVLVNASEFLNFFELLAETAILALAPSPTFDSSFLASSSSTESYRQTKINVEKICVVQLPKPEKIADALDIIKKGLQQKNC